MKKCLWGLAKDADGKTFGATIHIGPITQQEYERVCSEGECDGGAFCSCGRIIEKVCQNCGAIVDEFNTKR